MPCDVQVHSSKVPERQEHQWMRERSSEPGAEAVNSLQSHPGNESEVIQVSKYACDLRYIRNIVKIKLRRNNPNLWQERLGSFRKKKNNNNTKT